MFSTYSDTEVEPAAFSLKATEGVKIMTDSGEVLFQIPQGDVCELPDTVPYYVKDGVDEDHIRKGPHASGYEGVHYVRSSGLEA